MNRAITGGAFMTRFRWGTIALAMISVYIVSASVCGAQALETESARLQHAGAYELGTAFEFQTSSEGREMAVPLAVERGVTDRLSILVEPVAYTAIRPKRGTRATGFGDLEVTAFYLLGNEASRFPALAVAAEVKLPTTKDRLIGTGQTDYTGYLIASKRTGRLDVHANLGYTIIGRPPGVQLNNTFSGALAAEYRLGERAMLFGETLGTTSSAPEGGGDNPSSPTSAAPESAGGEVVGTAGVGVFPIQRLLLSLGISYDNNRAWLLRPGISWRSR
jgi:hypothetical protein